VSTSNNVISNYGPIKSISMPDGFTKTAYDPGEFVNRSTTTFCLSSDSSVEISLMFRGVPVSEKAASAFQQILDTVINSERDLSGDEIISLEEVLGIPGKNQYTVRTLMGKKATPPFNLTAAKAMRVKGRQAICVWGNFQDDGRQPINEYYGVFLDATRNPSLVFELFYLASDKMKFFYHLNDFETAIETIEWAD